MTKQAYAKLVSHLTAAAKELFEDHDLGFPNTSEEFLRCMWQDDSELKYWNCTRDEYRDAMLTVWDTLS